MKLQHEGISTYYKVGHKKEEKQKERSVSAEYLKDKHILKWMGEDKYVQAVGERMQSNIHKTHKCEWP